MSECQKKKNDSVRLKSTSKANLN